MNLLEARIEQSNGSLAAIAGSQRIALDRETIAAHPALAGFDGRTVVLGIRPEDLEDASIAADARDDARLRGTVELREALGAELMIHFGVDAKRAVTEDVRELAQDVTGSVEAASQLGDDEERAIMVGRFSPRSRVREGDTVEVAVDARALHFFNPETGLGIYDDATKGAPQ